MEQPQQAGDRAARIVANVESVIDGKSEVVETALVVLLAEGHLLIEDVPGVGKTVLAKALGASVGLTVRRIQFTPDLLPSDVTGVTVYDQRTGSFEFKPGAVFAHLVVGDEINRASPKTQSALLEAMEEGQVTVDGVTHPLDRPFTVIATQNPYEMEGTYTLPEAQRDRFMARISMGYPDLRAELEMLRDRDVANPLDSLGAVVGGDDVRQMIDTARATYVAPAVEEYCLAVVRSTREDSAVRLGASPRAALQLVRAAKARAFVRGRDFVLPDDIDALAVGVLSHRLVMVHGAEPAERAIQRIVAAVPVPAQSALAGGERR